MRDLFDRTNGAFQGRIPSRWARNVYASDRRDLAEMPHCLIAGTGSAIRTDQSIIASLLYKFSPDSSAFVY